MNIKNLNLRNLILIILSFGFVFFFYFFVFSATGVEPIDQVCTFQLVTAEPTGTAGFIAKWKDQTTLENSIIYQGNIGGSNNIGIAIGTTTPNYKLEVIGKACIGNGALCAFPPNEIVTQPKNSATATLFINYRSQDQITGSSPYRNLAIYDGRGNLIAYFKGDTLNVGIGTNTPDPNSSLHATNYIRSDTGFCIGSDCIANWSGMGSTTTISAANVSSGQFGANTGGGNYYFMGDVGIGTTSPQYTLDVNGSLRANSLTAGLNVETLTADKTLVPGQDKMYQWLDPGGTDRTVWLSVTGAKPGDRFVIKNNAPVDSSAVLTIAVPLSQELPNMILTCQQYPDCSDIDVIPPRAIREYIYYGGRFWIGANGFTGMLNNDTSLALGFRSLAFNNGVSIGNFANASTKGVSIGYASGLNLGFQNFDSGNTLIGAYSGYQLTTGVGNIIIGYGSGYHPVYSPTTGSYNILIGYNAWTPSSDTSNFLNIGGLIFGTNLSTNYNTLSTGNVGIGTTTPRDKLEVAGYVRAFGFNTGDIIFEKNNRKLWRLFEEEDGLYLENISSGEKYKILMQKISQ